MQPDRKQQDLELWEAWKRTRNRQYLDDLMNRLKPLIHREAVKWQSTLPPAVVESRGRQLALEALESYNPNMGAAIATHVTARLRKLSRMGYAHQNVARLPENKQLMFNAFSVAQGRVFDREGREATADELADELGWAPKKVQNFQHAFERRELVESEGLSMDGPEEDSSVVDFFYHGLPPKDKLLFEDITGYGGRTPLNNSQLRRKHNLTQGQLSYQKRKLVDQLKAIQQGRV